MIRASDVVYLLTRDQVIECAKEMGLPEEVITEDILNKVKKGIEGAWEGWDAVIKAAISYALKEQP